MGWFGHFPGRSLRETCLRAGVFLAAPLVCVLSCHAPFKPPQPAFVVEPDTLRFGSLPVDSTRVLAFRLINVGDAVFPVHPQPSLPAFQALGVDSLGIVVNPGDTVEVAVAFTPRHAGERLGRLELEGTGGRAVVCEGWAEGEGRFACKVDPLELDFGPVAPGATVRRKVAVNNTGTETLDVRVTLEGEGFSVVSGGGVFSLEPGQWHHVEVAFAPEGPGERTCVVGLGLEDCGVVTGRGYGRGTWYVRADGRGDAPTVQAAIDSARDGDVVLVGPGRYYENLDLKGKKIHLLGEKGRDETILDGSRGQSSVIVCKSGETNHTVIEGLTIRGGSGSHVGNGRYGGGIYCESCSPVIRGNRITQNSLPTSPAGGGAIHVDLLTHLEPLLIEDNEIISNASAQNGGGIDVTHGRGGALGSVVIQDNVIERNRTFADGAGIRVWGSMYGPIILRRNLVVSNEAGDHGGGMYLSNWIGATIDVHENIIIGNFSSGHPTPPDCSGGGIWMSQYGARIHHNTIAFNRAERTNGNFYAIGGICVLSPYDDPSIEYNLIYRNQEGAFGVYGLGSVGAKWTVAFRRNLHYGNIQEDVLTGTNQPGVVDVILEDDTVADPMFCVDGVKSRGEVAALSPALNQGWGPIGAVRTGGCGPGLPEASKATWGGMKARYASQKPPNRPGGRNYGPD